MQYYAIFTRHDYSDEVGAIRSKWYKVGYLKLAENGAKYIRLFQQPDTKFFCFETEESLPDIPIEN